MGGPGQTSDVPDCASMQSMQIVYSRLASIAAKDACRRTRLALRRKLVSSASSGSSTGLRSRLREDWAIDAKAFTAVSLVISFRKRSSNTCNTVKMAEGLCWTRGG